MTSAQVRSAGYDAANLAERSIPGFAASLDVTFPQPVHTGLCGTTPSLPWCGVADARNAEAQVTVMAWTGYDGM